MNRTLERNSRIIIRSRTLFLSELWLSLRRTGELVWHWPLYCDLDDPVTLTPWPLTCVCNMTKSASYLVIVMTVWLVTDPRITSYQGIVNITVQLQQVEHIYAPKWVRLAPKRDKSGIFQIRFCLFRLLWGESDPLLSEIWHSWSTYTVTNYDHSWYVRFGHKLGQINPKRDNLGLFQYILAQLAKHNLQETDWPQLVQLW